MGDVREPVVLGPGEGRPYAMGAIHAVFKADGEETAGRYNVSEWWLEPHTHGPGAHAHDEDDAFFVIDGKYGVSGAQDAATFANVLSQVQAERETTP